MPYWEAHKFTSFVCSGVKESMSIVTSMRKINKYWKIKSKKHFSQVKFHIHKIIYILELLTQQSNTTFFAQILNKAEGCFDKVIFFVKKI